jgi:hypothetical protein
MAYLCFQCACHPHYPICSLKSKRLQSSIFNILEGSGRFGQNFQMTGQGRAAARSVDPARTFLFRKHTLHLLVAPRGAHIFEKQGCLQRQVLVVCNSKM